MIINDKLTYIFNLLKKKYSYLSLTDDNLYEILLRFNAEEVDESNYYTLLENAILNVTKKLFNDSKKTKKIIDKYINSNFGEVNNYNDAIIYLKDLSVFLNKLDTMIEPDYLLDLVAKNSKLNAVLSLIVKNNKDEIEKGNLGYVFCDNIMLSMIEGYCVLNNITIGTDNNEETNKKNEEFNTEEDNIYSRNGFITYTREIGRIPVLKPQEQKKLAFRVKNGDEEAKLKFYESNLRLVVYYARRHGGKYLHLGVDIMDLIQEGNIGLFKAVEKFDPTLGYKFSTYAIWWIKQYIQRYVSEHSRSIRIPIWTQEKLNRYNKIVENIRKIEGREPSIEEVAQKMGVSVQDAISFYAMLQNIASLNDSVSPEHDDTELIEMLPSQDKSVEKEVESGMFPAILQEIFEKYDFTPNEITVLWYRYGFADNKTRTFKELEDIIGLSRQRAEQIEKRAFLKIRENPNIMRELLGSASKSDIALVVSKDKKRKKKQEPTLIEEVIEEPVTTKESEEEKYQLENPTYYYPFFVQFTNSFFIQFAFDEIDYAFELLNDLEKSIIVRLYGNDLKQPYSNDNVSLDEEVYFQKVIIPKMIRNIKSLYVDRDGNIHIGNAKSSVMQKR